MCLVLRWNQLISIPSPNFCYYVLYIFLPLNCNAKRERKHVNSVMSVHDWLCTPWGYHTNKPMDGRDCTQYTWQWLGLAISTCEGAHVCVLFSTMDQQLVPLLGGGTPHVVRYKLYTPPPISTSPTQRHTHSPQRDPLGDFAARGYHGICL